MRAEHLGYGDSQAITTCFKGQDTGQGGGDRQHEIRAQFCIRGASELGVCAQSHEATAQVG